MNAMRTAMPTLVALVAFAANSLLCRMALGGNEVDASAFTTVRLCSGALVLAPFAWRSRADAALRPSWLSAFALFAYAIAFSFAYTKLSTGTGALLLFGAVQTTMIGAALFKGERPRAGEWAGLVLALAGLVWLVAPGVAAPPLLAAALMVAAGIAWGAYSLRGRGAPSPATATAWSFMRAAPLALVVTAALTFAPSFTNESAAITDESAFVHANAVGVVLAAVSGAVTSGLGYVAWYAALRSHTATSAAIVQLAVPVLAGVAGVVVLDENVTLRLALAGALVLGGVALASLARMRA